MRSMTPWLLILLWNVAAWAQNSPSWVVKVSFQIDGKPASCSGFQITMRFAGETIEPKQTGMTLEVPAVFRMPARHWGDGERVEMNLTCSGHSITFTNHPAFLRLAEWTFGFAHPVYAVENYGYTRDFNQGTWLAYLIFESEPGVVETIPQTVPLEGSFLLAEQGSTKPERARDIAYTLAVSEVEYQKNRDYLLSTLNSCLNRQERYPVPDECDGNLLKFVANLYWRGDDDLLAMLLRTERKMDVLDEVGGFYAEMLRYRGEVMLSAMANLLPEKQQVVCRLAYDDNLTNDAPNRERVTAFLRSAKSAVASSCLKGLSAE